jgi:HSP20 family protein
MRALSQANQNRSPAMWNPFSIFSEMRRQMDDLMNDVIGQQGSGLVSWRPTLEVDEDDQSFTIRVEVPGWEEKDITVEVEQSLLTIRGERGASGGNDSGGGNAGSTSTAGSSAGGGDVPDADESGRSASSTDEAQMRSRAGSGGRGGQGRNRWSSSFIQSLSLPSTIDTEHISAQLERGLLTVHLPKQPQATPKRIPVGASRNLGSSQGGVQSLLARDRQEGRQQAGGRQDEALQSTGQDSGQREPAGG